MSVLESECGLTGHDHKRPKFTVRANISFAFRGVKTSLPPNLRGWDTGTLEVSDVQLDIESSKTDLIDSKGAQLRIVTTESSQVLPKKEAEVHGNTVNWSIDLVRLPLYTRYQSSVVFEIGKTSGITSLVGKSKPQAIAVLWLQDLTDDIEQEVKLPVFAGERLDILRQNVINDQTAKHHKFELVGFLTTRLKLDSGLDEDHEVGTGVNSILRYTFAIFQRLW